jgi:hypothetical protein
MQEPKDTFDAVVSALIAERASPRKKSTKKTSRGNRYDHGSYTREGSADRGKRIAKNVALHSIAEHARGSDRDRLADGIETE